jgi:hypothetical protein
MLDLVIVEIIRSPDLRHTKETHWRHLSYLDVTSNVSVSRCAGELLKRADVPE